MGDEYLNGCPAEDFEAAAIRHARQCERDRDQEQLKGVLTEEREPVLPGRGTDTLSLPVLS